VPESKANDQALFERFGRAYRAGEVVFKEGDAGHEMYVIQTGRVLISRRVRGREQHLLTLTAGEFFGEMAIVNNRPRSATATVIEESRLLIIDGKTFESMVRGNAEIALRFIKKLAARLERANQQVEALLVQDLNHRVVRQLRNLASSRGVPEGPGVRVEITVDEIADELDAGAADVAHCIERLEQAKLVHSAADGLHIAQVGKLDQFLEFLEMKERLGDGR
jgi:CRP-like cAMP-binding protein